MDATRFVERLIAKRLIADAIAAGYHLDVYDGEERITIRGDDPKVILAAMFSTDEDYVLFVQSNGKESGLVRLIYGNGVDVISDYTTNLEAVVSGANALAERLAQSYGL